VLTIPSLFLDKDDATDEAVEYLDGESKSGSCALNINPKLESESSPLSSLSRLRILRLVPALKIGLLLLLRLVSRASFLALRSAMSSSRAFLESSGKKLSTNFSMNCSIT